ncbi:MAG: ABC transporter permease [Lewinellaceae bacterium]|nr:ABC transporter permease [Lewinellaceae bacterium]
MRTVFFLVQKEFLQIFRNKVMLPLLLVMPVFQTVLLSFAANYEIKNLSLAVVDNDHSPTSMALIHKFTASGYFRLEDNYPSIRSADDALAADKVDLTLEIPPQMERNMVREGSSKVSLTANAINAVKAGLAVGYANNILRDFNLEQAPKFAKAGVAMPALIDVSYSNWYNPKLDYKTFMVPGILGEIVSLIICFLTALAIVREREMGTIEQINVTPVKKWQFIVGKLLPFWLLSLVMMAVGLTVGWLVFRIPMEGSLGLVFLYTMFFTPGMLGIGFLISNFSETQQQAMFTAWFFLIIFILMCGLFTPVDSMPQWAQYLNMLNPVKYFVAFMRLVLLKGAGFAEIKWNFLSVVTIAVVANTLAVWTYRKRVA